MIQEGCSDDRLDRIAHREAPLFLIFWGFQITHETVHLFADCFLLLEIVREPLGPKCDIALSPIRRLVALRDRKGNESDWLGHMTNGQVTEPWETSG